MPNDINNNNPQDPQNPFNPFQSAQPNVNENPAQDDLSIPNTPVTDTVHSMPENLPQGPQAQSGPQQAPQEEYPQDERIVEYLVTQVIPARHPEMAADQVVAEKDRLYKILENGIFETAYSQLDEEHKNELDTLMKYGANIPAIQTFFIEKIPNIQEQLGKYMEDFVQKYLKGEI